MRFGIRVTERSTGDTSIGFFAADRKATNYFPRIQQFTSYMGGFEQVVGLRDYDANGETFDATTRGSLSGPFALNTYHHNKLTYAAMSKQATLLITSTSGVFLNTTVSIPGGLPTVVPRLGASSSGFWSSSGMQQRVESDNLSVDNASAVSEPTAIAIWSVLGAFGFASERQRRPRKAGWNAARIVNSRL